MRSTKAGRETSVTWWGTAHSTAQTDSGSGRPLSVRSPSGRSLNSLLVPARARTRSLTRIWLPSASAQSREASTTGVPNQSSSSKVASPALTPTRMTSGRPSTRRFLRSTDRCMATAPARASAAPRYETMTASPIVLTSVPPVAAIASRRSAKWDRRSSSATRSPTSAASSVDPTRSVNKIDTSPASATLPHSVGPTPVGECGKYRATPPVFFCRVPRDPLALPCHGPVCYGWRPRKAASRSAGAAPAGGSTLGPKGA